MALAQVVLVSLFLIVFCLGFASTGMRILRVFRIELSSRDDHVLVSIAVGLIIVETVLFLVQFTQHIKLGSFAIAFVLLGLLLCEWKLLFERLRSMLRPVFPAVLPKTALRLCLAIVIPVEFLVAMAPLTGSDAMHYHFTVQREILEQGFHPVFSNSHSFLCGQHHLLILFGLSLGSEQLALGFIFLGGLLTAISMARLMSHWMSADLRAAFVLLFLLTPVVFWQISTSGAPDIFMGFLTCAALIVLREEGNAGSWRQIALSGFLVGGIAGAKYTGCIVAGIFLVIIVMEFRSLLDGFIFALASLISGAWPYLRNLAWTGDPVFPFLSTRLSSYRVNAFAMASLASDTGASASHDPSRLLPFVLLASAQKDNPGFFDFFGPTVLVLAPLILLVFRNNRAWRVPLLVWCLSALGVFFTSGLPRFLLPIFPIALLCVGAGLEGALRKRWIIATRVAVAVLVVMLMAGGAGLALYSKKPILAATGLLSGRNYLEKTAPDYEIAEVVNRVLKGQGKALVFIRHQYYLDIPYVNGDPGTSLEVDPEYLKTTQAWRQFLAVRSITYVVRSPEYPRAISESLEKMESDGDLIPVAQLSVQTLQGKRIEQQTTTIPVVILKVRR